MRDSWSLLLKSTSTSSGPSSSTSTWNPGFGLAHISSTRPDSYRTATWPPMLSIVFVVAVAPPGAVGEGAAVVDGLVAVGATVVAGEVLAVLLGGAGAGVAVRRGDGVVGSGGD
ncbi:MAG: hypothetical protein KY454_03690 [Actinobacteria bacterium]|nr:hypothetical protein [Actinomycetota bacterium]